MVIAFLCEKSKELCNPKLVALYVKISIKLSNDNLE
jgi:hypothetical protein